MIVLVGYEIHNPEYEALLKSFQEKILNGRVCMLVDPTREQTKPDDKIILFDSDQEEGSVVGRVVCRLPSLFSLKNKLPGARAKAKQIIEDNLDLLDGKTIQEGPITPDVLKKLRDLGMEISFPDIGLGISEEGSDTFMTFDEVKELLKLSTRIGSSQVMLNGHPFLLMGE